MILGRAFLQALAICLDRLMNLGKVRCYYEIKQAPEHEHLVCHGCGKFIELKSHLVGMLIDEGRREHGFNLTEAKLYLEGYCIGYEEKGEAR
jgi:Fe2+ or Zn2+ uptake regulation protein